MFKKNKAGFSLIELLITIAIIAMTAVISLSYLNNNTKKDKILEVSAEEMIAAIRETQNNALNGKQTEGSKIPCNYQFIKNGSGGYKILYYYHSAGSTDCSASQDFAAYVLKNGVTVDNFTPIRFDVPFATGVSATTIRIRKDSREYYVCVAASGDVFPCKTNSCDKSTCLVQ